MFSQTENCNILHLLPRLILMIEQQGYQTNERQMRYLLYSRIDFFELESNDLIKIKKMRFITSLSFSKWISYHR